MRADESALQAFQAGLKVAPKHYSLRNNLGLALVLGGRHDEGIEMLEDVATDPDATEVSHKNLQLAYAMMSTAGARQEIAQADVPRHDAAQQSGSPAGPRAAPADAMPQRGRGHRIAASPVAKRGPEIESRHTTTGTPVQLIQDAQQEKAQSRLGAAENPIEVSTIDDPPMADQAPTGTTGETGSFRRSPLRMQTARAASTDLADSGSPSAVLSDYFDAEASFDETPAEPVESARETAALQPVTSTPTEMNTELRYAVQLASYLSEERAIRGWAELRAVAPDLLDPIEPVVRQADLGDGRGTVYRLRTAPATKGAAYTLCTELQSRGIDCLVIKEAPSGTDAGSQFS